MKPNPERLTCVSIIVCDDVYRDEASKKLVIIGTFNRIQAISLPCLHPRMTVLFTLTNGKGDYDLALWIEHEKTGRRVAELRAPLRVDDPLAISDVNVELRNVVFTEPGKYWVAIEADGGVVQQRPFWVELLPSPAVR
jgi:hypothetical protein